MEQFKIILVIVFLNIFSQKSNLSEFQFTRLLNGKLDLVVPRRLSKVSDQELVAKFPIAAQRPTIVFENSKSNEKLSISYGSSFAEDKDLPMIGSYFEKMYKPVSYRFINRGLKEVRKKPLEIIEFDMLNKVTGQFILNHMYFTTIDSKLLIVNYSNEGSDRSRLDVDARTILESLTIKP